ncbi:MAG: TonB-dependent receptor, partial [Acidobacteria bacterium]|nr:TonB-dependent receptor [Acidobacteriota bacterium]
VSDKQRIFFRWSNAQYDQTASTLPTAVTNTLVDRTAWGVLLDDVYVFNPQLLLNVRYGVNYQNPRNYRGSQGFDVTSLGFPQSLMNEIASKADIGGLTFPQVQIDGSAYTGLGQNGGDNAKTYYHNFSATATRIAGTHSLRFGGEYRVMQENGFNYGNVAPQLVFAQAYTRGPLDNAPVAPIGQGLASMLLGIPTGGLISINASRAEQSAFWSGYLQDDWRITRKLTVNLGLRYEYEGPPTERHNRSVRGFDFSVESPIATQAKANYARNPISELPANQFRVMGGLTFAGVNGQARTLWNADKNNFAPRVGIAYQLNARTVIRAGYGIFYDAVGVDRQDVNQGGFNQSTNLIPSIDNGRTYQASLSNPFPFGLQVPPGASGGLATFLGRGASYFDSNSVNPYMQRWSLSVQRELPGRVLFETSYLGNRGTKLGVQHQFTATPAEYLSTLPYRDQPKSDYLSAQVPNPFYGIPDFVGTALGSQTISRGNLLKPYPHFSGITANVPTGYSWFHSLQTGVEKRMSSGLSFQVAWTYSKYMDATAYLNDTDLRPEEVVSASDYPHRLVINGMYELPFGRGRTFLSNATGIVQGLFGGWQFQGLYEAQSGQALGFGNAIFNGDLQNIPLPVSDRRIARWFNTDAGFERNNSKSLVSNIQGLSSRFNNVRRDGINNFQLSTYKNFRVRERYTLRFLFFAINALNHPQFGPPNTNPTNTAFGTVSAIRGPARQLVTSLKFLF